MPGQRGNHLSTGSARAKVALSLCRGWNTSLTIDASDFVVPFLIPEEEQFVFLDWPANVVAPVVMPQDWFVLVRTAVNAARHRIKDVCSPVVDGVLGREPIIGIKLVVATAVEHAAMPLVGAAFGHNVNDRAASLP